MPGRREMRSQERTYLVTVKGTKKSVSCSAQMLEKHLNFHLLDHCRFRSEKERLQARKSLPWLMRPWFYGVQNESLIKHYLPSLENKELADISIRWIDEQLGYGLFAEKSIQAGDFIGEFCGVIKPVALEEVKDNAYCLLYPTYMGSFQLWVIDALKEGGVLRFANHSDEPNMKMQCLVHEGIQRFFLIAGEQIPPNVQLTWDYGENFWRKRKKHKYFL